MASVPSGVPHLCAPNTTVLRYYIPGVVSSLTLVFIHAALHVSSRPHERDTAPKTANAQVNIVRSFPRVTTSCLSL